MTSDEAHSHDSLPDLDRQDAQRIGIMRLAGKIKDEQHVRMSGLQSAVTAEKLYRKDQKTILAAGRAVGLPIEKRSTVRGADDPQAPVWSQAIALVHPEGTPDNTRMRAFMGLPPVLAPAAENEDADDLAPLAPGGVGFAVTLAPPEERINAAVASLGNRTGARIPDIVADLTEALHARELDLPAGDLNGIAAELARGEEVIIQVVTGDSGDSHSSGGRW